MSWLTVLKKWCNWKITTVYDIDKVTKGWQQWNCPSLLRYSHFDRRSGGGRGIFPIMDNTGKCETAAFCITNGFWGLALWDESLFNTLLVTLSLRHCPLLTWERWYWLTILALSTILSGFSLSLILLPSHNFGSSDAQCWTTRLWFLCGMLHLPRVPVCTNEWKKKPVISALVIGGFINIFSRRTTGFHRQANLVELNFFTKNTSLEMVTSGSQNHPTASQ